MSGLLYPKSPPRVIDKREQRRAHDANWRKVMATVKRRDGGRCRMCGAVGTDPHHLLARSLGGKDTVENVAWMCRPCHDFVQQHVTRIVGTDANRTLRFERNTFMR